MIRTYSEPYSTIKTKNPSMHIARDGATSKSKVGPSSYEELELKEHAPLATRLIELREGLGPPQTFDVA